MARGPVIAVFSALLLGCSGSPENSKRDDAEASAPATVETPTTNREAPPGIPGLREFPLPAGPGSYAPSLASAGDLLYLAWYERSADGRVALRFARHDGNAWGDAETLVASETIGFDARVAPSIGVIGDLTVYIGWPERTATGRTAFRLSRSRGAGKRWEPPQTVFETSTLAPTSPSIAPEGTKSARLTWIDLEAGSPRLMSTGLTESGPFAGAGTAAKEVDRNVCTCCPLSAVGSRAGHLLLARIEDARGLRLHTGAGHHDVGSTDPEVTCTGRFTSLASATSTIAAAWSNAGDDRAACVAFNNSPKDWPKCIPLGSAAQAPVGDLLLMDSDVAVVTLSSRARDDARSLQSIAVRRDGVLGSPKTVANITPCPDDACGHLHTTAFGDRIVWTWTDPGVQGQSRLRAAIAPAAAVQ